ncbi:MAG: hypothetical protein KDD36_09325 [Flavobacteriales bacterium]|nr:hypothetical protein [Flavobacteriales bacterium]
MEELELISTAKREQLFKRYAKKLEVDKKLSRQVVSFQANKEVPFYRWFKYKEGFSSILVKHFLETYHPKPGRILDPFAGAGATLFAAQELGWESVGVELLPVGVFAMEVRDQISGLDIAAFEDVVNTIWGELDKKRPYDNYIHHISITKDAFSQETETYLNKYLTFAHSLDDDRLCDLLRFAAFCVLEEISFTRKDGQYLRWDYRSQRDLKGKFDKGKIYDFREAAERKLAEMLHDLKAPTGRNTLFDKPKINKRQPLQIINDSCLNALPSLEAESFDFIFTSPPYCNRYDYTRTYALELIFLGCNHDRVKELRQTMLSCTVENREKVDLLHQFYKRNGQLGTFEAIMQAYRGCEAMTETNTALRDLNNANALNNSNIARMVENYFLEMCFVIYEMSRVLRPGGYSVMVNDNVRYGGQEVPVDIILSRFAESFGMKVNKIFVLPKGKGNSSQQMGNYGRTEIRKCVYLWQKL